MHRVPFSSGITVLQKYEPFRLTSTPCIIGCENGPIKRLAFVERQRPLSSLKTFLQRKTLFIGGADKTKRKIGFLVFSPTFYLRNRI